MAFTTVFLAFMTLSYALGALCQFTPGPVIEGRSVCIEGFCTWTVNLRPNSSLPDMSLGIAMPPRNSGLSELMINVSVPLPYGFVSITTGEDDASPDFMAFFGISVSEDLLAPLNLSCLRSQVANLSGDNLVTNPNMTNTTISANSTKQPATLQIVSRIQSSLFEVLPLFASNSTIVNVNLSMNAPSYLDSADETAVLNLTGSATASFTFDNSDATFTNYTQMAKVVGL